MFDPYIFQISNIQGLQAALNAKQNGTLSTPIVVDGTTCTTVESALNAINDESANISIIAADFSTSTDYKKGDYCNYEGGFYRFITSHNGAWNYADVVSTTVDDEIDRIVSYIPVAPGLKPIDFGAYYQGLYVWKEGEHIYYSKGNVQKEFNKETKTWSNKTWTGLTSFNGNRVWTDGTDVYYSAGGGIQYVLDKETSAWSSITWTGFNSIEGENIWYDGENIQYNKSTSKYTLNKTTGEWEVQTTPAAPTNFNGSEVWTDGEDIYLSVQAAQYILDKENHAWVSKTWTGTTNFNGSTVWTDGDNVYTSGGSSHQYVLDKAHSAWIATSWYGPMVDIYGYNFWTDDDYIYYDNGSFSGTLYEYNFLELIGIPNGIAGLGSDGRIPVSQSNYVTAGQKSGTTLGANATAEGSNTTANQAYAHAEGNNTKATNYGAHAEGNYTTASGQYSHAEGNYTTASGQNSHAEGDHTDTNLFIAAHAEGYYTKNGTSQQHVEGAYNIGNKYTRHEIGNGTSTSARSNVFEVTFSDQTITYGETYNVVEKTNIASVADCGTIQSIEIAVSDAGVVTTTYSSGTINTYNMTAGHTGILAWNSKTDRELVYIKKGESYTFSFSTARPSLTIDSVLISVISDEITDAAGNVLSKKTNLSVIAEEFDSIASYAVGDYVVYDGLLYKCVNAHSGEWSALDFQITLVSDEFGSGGGGVADLSAIAPTFSSSTAYAVGDFVTYEGKLYKCTTAHAAGAWDANDFTEVTVVSAFMAKGSDYVTAGQKSGTTLGARATAEGYNATASGTRAHAEGSSTTASALAAHAEGEESSATAEAAHAEGYNTEATAEAAHSEGRLTGAAGTYSHAEGYGSTAGHSTSHAEGLETQTGVANQHVQGKYNVGKSTTAFEIGNGTGSSARSNAFEVEWDGDTTAAGEITDGGGNVLSDKFDATSYVDRFERYTISSSNWSANADENGYYTYSLTTSAYNTYKGVEMSVTGSADGVDPTSAQKAAFNLINKWYMNDGTGVTSATLYAKTKPTTTFYVMLKGNYAARNAASSTKALDITTGCALTVGVGNSTSAFNGGTERTLKWVKNTVKLSASGWSNTVNASGYYNIGAQLATKIFTDNPVPEVTLIGNSSGTASASVLPTAAEQAAYNLIDYFEMADSGLNRNLFVFAKTKPTTDVYLLIEGMSLT